MIDVNKITSTLAKLPDQQLQQYAQMHKNDPYIMALAMSESNRRKEMRSAGQSAQGAQEQPKVVDQAVAEMAPQQLPEEMGIGQLPAGDMSFADGGIVAFADGGDVERYYGGGSTAIYDPVTGVPISAENTSGNDLTFLESIGVFNPENRRALEQAERAAQKQKSPAYNRATMPAAGYTRPAMANDPRMATAPSTPFVAAPPAATAPRSLSGAPAAAPAPAAGLAALDPNKLFATALEKASKEERPEKGMLERLNEARGTAAEAELTGVKELNEKFANAFKGRRERLDKQETELGERKDQNFGLALLQAGAAMMSTPGSLGTAIGKGIQSGSQQYVAGIDKLNAAKDKLADARDRLDDLQLNRDEMSAREILKAENKIRDTALSGQENMIKFVMDRDKVDRETAMKVVDNQIKLGIAQAENVSRENVARITTAPALERNAMLKLAESKDVKVRTEYGKLQAKVMDTLNKDDNYKMAKPEQQQIMQTNALRQALMNNPFLSEYAANVGFSKAPAGTGKVYDLTGD
jgi:hypothetical protein